MGRMVISSKLTEVSKVQGILLDEAKAHGFGREACWSIRLALDEALNNAIRHGNGGDPSKKVTIDFEVTEKQARIKVRDEGGGFNPGDLPDPTLNENLVRPHGRGVMLMKTYMSEVHFDCGGNTVTLVKRRDCIRPIHQD